MNVNPIIFYFPPNNKLKASTNNKPTNNSNKLYNSNNGTNGCLKEMPPKDRLLIILRNCFRHAKICTGDCDDVLQEFFIYFMNINDEYKNILKNMQKKLEEPITVENQKKINKMGKNSGNQNTNNNNRNNLKKQTTNINNSKTNKIGKYVVQVIKNNEKENTDKVIELILKHNNKKNTNNNPNNKTIEKILEDFISNIKSNPDGVKAQRNQKFFA